MPPARSVRPRTTRNENDEYNPSTRLTRAKAANLTGSEDLGGKRPLATKKSAINGTTKIITGTKRAALGDVSNVTKSDVDHKENKKPLATKGTSTLKATNVAVPKASRPTTTTRPVLGAREAVVARKSSADLKRPAAASGLAGGAVAKKRNTGSAGSEYSIEAAKENAENEPPQARGQSAATIRRSKVEVVKESAIAVPVAEAATLQLPSDVPDLDAEDLDDPLMVAEYVGEIFNHLVELESERMPNPNYMANQMNIEWHLRGVLVDWLVEVHTRFHLLPETLFLAVNIIDRFLSRRVVELEKLQLVGITAMFIASKYEEVLSPHVQNFRHIADDGFSEEEILKAERFVLATLNYDLSYPNPMNFLRRISKADNYDIQTRTLGKYLVEISLVDHRLLPYTPSHLSAAAMFLARLILERGVWDATLVHYAGYSEEDIMPVFRLMVDYLSKPVAHEAFFKKYASKKFMKASILSRQWAKKNFCLYLLDGADGNTVYSDEER